DVIEVPAVIDGFKVLFADMAGLRESADPIEAEGVRRARAWAEAADLRLWVVDQSASGQDMSGAAALAQPGDVLVFNKSDLPAGGNAEITREGLVVLEVSARTGEGMD